MTEGGRRWSPRKPKWAWRDYLTDEEREALDAADRAKRAWEKLNAERAKITNRAIQRARLAGRRALEEGTGR